MSDMQHFDKHVKGAFDDYAPDVPAGSWEKIMAERQHRKPMPVWWSFLQGKNMLLFSGLLLAVAAGVGLYQHFKNDEKKTSNIVKQAINTIPVENKAQETSATKNNASKQTTTNNNIDKNTTAKENTTLSDDQKATALYPKPIYKTSGMGSVEKRKKNRGTVSKSNYVTTVGSGSVQAEEVAEDKTLMNDLFNDKTKRTPLVLKSKHPFTQKTKGRVQSKTMNAAIEDIGEPVSNESFLTGGTIMGKLLFSGEIISAGSFLTSSLNKNTITGLALTDPRCPPSEKDAAGNKQYWEIYAGPDFAFKKYNDTANSTYLEKRKSSTSFQSAFSAGARYTRVFENGMSIRGGINYSQVNEKFSFIQGNITQVTYVTNAMGDTTGSYVTRGTRYKTSFNHYHTLDVPVMVGYELGNGRLHANINAGAVINIYSWQKGDVLDTSFQPVDITTGKGITQYQYKTNVGLGFMSAVSVYYKLKDRLHLLAEPFVRYNFSPMNNDNFSLQEKFTTIGLRLGIRMDF